MRDYALLASLIVAFGAPALLARRWWTLHSVESHIRFLDVVMGPVALGLVAGRVITLMLDDRRALLRLSDLLVIRSGVEFWPALAAAVGWAAWGARRDGVRPSVRLAELAPSAMVGYAAYEVSCVWRDGCFGPESPLGLHPDGITTRMLPIGILVGASVVVVASVLRFVAPRISPPALLLGAVGSVAGFRAVASFWLPHLGEGITRQHRASIAVAFAATVALGVMELARLSRRRSLRVAVEGRS
ncbi:MAG TPA: hypothetical protein VM282_21300 [Acidimicrobiales bacterium]|nr:hypothetical protein [Acidimicrobiales bacterium]